uniref:primase-helicase family protein n=2 Tax=Cupriavidus taiwanensis TaxID=164546 RepID=UPI0018DC5629
MTAQIIQLQSEASASQSNTANNLGPTEAEKKVIAAYVKVLQRRGWCKIDAENAKETRLFNRYSKTTRSFSYLRNNFDEWLDNTGNECDFYNERYFTRGLTHIVGQVFDPNGKDYTVDSLTGCRYANTYQRHVPTTEDADVSPLFHEFFERLFPDENERKIVLQYISHMFQHPDERPSWHLMLLSQPGTGKGYLVQKILHPILNHTSVLYKFEQVMGRFSSVITENLLILLDDCKSKSDATQTQLKSLLSEERTYVERKFASV